MKKFILLYLSLLLFMVGSFYYDIQLVKYFLFGFIVFQFLLSLGTFLLDNEDLKEINNGKKIPLQYIFILDLLFISSLFYFNQTIFGCLWFIQSFLIHNTFIKAELLYDKPKSRV